jgi:hypothetical protein
MVAIDLKNCLEKMARIGEEVRSYGEKLAAALAAQDENNDPTLAEAFETRIAAIRGNLSDLVTAYLRSAKNGLMPGDPAGFAVVANRLAVLDGLPMDTNEHALITAERFTLTCIECLVDAPVLLEAAVDEAWNNHAR